MPARRFASMLAFLTVASATHQVIADTFGIDPSQFEIEFVTIGNPGNLADTSGEPNPAGSVDCVYRIGRFEVSQSMVARANAEAKLGISLTLIEDGGNGPDQPATGVTWNEAAQFANWLNTSQGYPAAYKFETQPGELGYNANADISLWVDADTGFDPTNPFRNRQARYVLASVDECYKAAYYDPSAMGERAAIGISPREATRHPQPWPAGQTPTRRSTSSLLLRASCKRVV